MQCKCNHLLCSQPIHSPCKACTAYLAVVLLVEDGMCLLRDGRAGHDNLHDLTIFAALLTQVLYHLQAIATECTQMPHIDMEAAAAHAQHNTCLIL